MVTEFGHHGIKTLDYGRNGRLRANVTIMCCNDEFSWLFTKRLSTTRLMKIESIESSENGKKRHFEKDLAIFCK